MIGGYKILTVTHHNVKLNTLGHYAFSCEDTELPGHLLSLKKQTEIDEVLYLSTCNRIMYFFYTDQEVDNSFISSFFQQVNHSADLPALDQVQKYEGREALVHLFEVAASMNSLVVGEREILRQLREAYKKCYDLKLTGDHIRLAMTAAGISRNARILLVGAGQTNTLVVKFLRKHEFKNITIFNRNLDRAREIEDLRNLAKENLSFRQNEVVKGRKMLKRKIETFSKEHQQRQIVKAMKNVPEEIKAVKSHAINKVFKKDMEGLDEETKELINRMMDYMEKQCIGIPMKAVKR